MIAKVIATAKVDTVVHAAMTAGGHSTMNEMNVIGTMQLLAACQRSATVMRLVVKSTSAVYGASPRDPAVLTEGDEPANLPARGYAKDAAEIEGYIRGFARRRDDVDVTVLRFTDVIGPHIDTALSRYFALPVVPTVLGYAYRDRYKLAAVRAWWVRLLGIAHSDDDHSVLYCGCGGDLPDDR